MAGSPVPGLARFLDADEDGMVPEVGSGDADRGVAEHGANGLLEREDSSGV